MFNRFEAERYLLLAGDLPGYDVRLALRSAGRARGEVIGEVTVARTPALARRHRPESGLARARPLGRAAARPVLRPDRARRPHHASPCSPPPTSPSSRRSSSPTISGSAARASRSAASSLMPGRGPDLGDPGDRHRLAHLVRDAGGELPVRPPPGADPARRRRPRHRRPGHRFQRPRAQPRPAPRRLRAARFRTRSASPATGATRRPSRVWRLSASAELAPGARPARRQPGLRAAARRLPRARRGAADPLRGRSDRDRAARRRSTASSGRCRAVTFALGARGQYSGDPLLSFEEFSGRQLQRRPRLRSRHPARRQRRRPPGRAALRQRSIRRAPTEFAFEPYRLLRSGLGVERGPAVRAAAARS